VKPDKMIAQPDPYGVADPPSFQAGGIFDACCVGEEARTGRVPRVYVEDAAPTKPTAAGAKSAPAA
jgi:hypothetical protein